MNTHEFQAKEVLKEYGIPIPPFALATTPQEVEEAVARLNLSQGVAKVQVHAGGRGKAGGVKLAKNREELIREAKHLLGFRIVNDQTGPEGLVSHQVMISPLTEFLKEYYVGCVIDRESARSVLIVSTEGGIDIEKVAQEAPEKIVTLPIRWDGKLHHFQLVEVAKFMKWEGKTAKQGMDLIAALARAFVEKDASLLEINPLVLTPEGDLVALDAKLSVDDNALYRQPEIRAFYDVTQVNPQEARAKEFDLSYIALEGNVGCMVNGAGLAMATMDIIKYYGGSPANFLDVGGSASKEKVAEGFKIILSDPQVKGILVNIFGGIMNCATLAEGIVSAANELSVQVPLVVRMEGTNVAQGKEILKKSNLNIITAEELGEAAEKVVRAIQ